MSIFLRQQAKQRPVLSLVALSLRHVLYVAAVWPVTAFMVLLAFASLRLALLVSPVWVVGFGFVCDCVLIRFVPSFQVFRRMVSFRRRWPALWAAVSSRGQLTASRKAEKLPVSLTREPFTSPRLGFWPSMSAGLVSWRVYVPYGQTLTDIADVADALAANCSKVLFLVVESQKPTSSVGRLVVGFVDPLTEVREVSWS